MRQEGPTLQVSPGPSAPEAEEQQLSCRVLGRETEAQAVLQAEVQPEMHGAVFTVVPTLL